MSYQVLILPTAARDCDRLSKETYLRCQKSISKLGENPRTSGAIKLVGEDGYRIRVGDYRILYRIDDLAKKIFIYRVKHRREVYR